MGILLVGRLGGVGAGGKRRRPPLPRGVPGRVGAACPEVGPAFPGGPFGLGAAPARDLGVVAGLVDEVNVLYAGRIVERAGRHDLFADPRHPYTGGLLGSIPRLDRRTSHLATIEGMVPNMASPPAGCRFAARCPFVENACTSSPPPLAMLSATHASRCIRAPLERLVS